MDGVSDRDFAIEYLFAASLLLSHLSRLAEDLIFFSTDEAGFIELPDALATGSSRMPQKKNPDVLELVRGHAARAIGELTGLLTLMKGLPLAYDKDLQLDKEPLFRMRATLGVVLPALTALIAGLKLNREDMRRAASDDLLLATAVADAIAAKGTPFREAHDIVSGNLGKLHELAKEHGVTLESVLAKKNALGGTSPQRVHEAAQQALEALR
jgi:argininosuccinate lyase